MVLTKFLLLATKSISGDELEENLVLKLPEEMRPVLRRPLGILLRDAQSFLGFLKEKNPPRLVAVGDVVTASLLEAGVEPDIVVVDSTVMRSPVEEDVRKVIKRFKGREVKVKNPAGTITPELRRTLKTARPPVKVVVEGEEDLATIPAVLSSPIGSLVVYGQPGQGLVAVEVTGEKREEFLKFLQRFEKMAPP
jgi:hypothetical protein